MHKVFNRVVNRKKKKQEKKIEISGELISVVYSYRCCYQFLSVTIDYSSLRLLSIIGLVADTINRRHLRSTAFNLFFFFSVHF